MIENKKKFPGTLVLVVGNSGSGKDSIISGAIKRRSVLLKGTEIRSPKRCITRPMSLNENNIQVTPEIFKSMASEGKFAIYWEIYGLQYGVPIEIDDWLSKGSIVIVNVSRNVIEIARAQYEQVMVVFIKVPLDKTIERLEKRGRESGKSLEERIERAKKNQDFNGADFTIDNSGSLNDAIDRFLNLLFDICN
ncbi:MAG: phosphonate metabolism protein/1,5-bisphosphokinase (PRPP-forming) PhnN [Candidatus Lokiarchaeota archaeon]|nr:phosphonate metabolism protein/1,5-bisphosphokinase (PRPP-forming) PhnN [Candidatus Lokiarchaeota archaeon]